MEKARKTKQLKWSMIRILTICWFLPLFLITVIMLFFVSDRMNRQLENTIVTSADKAIEICQIRLAEIMGATKDASYIPTIKEGYIQYLNDGDIDKLKRTVGLFLENYYRYDSSFNMTYVYFIDVPRSDCVTYRGQNTWANVTAFQKYAREEISRISKGLDTDIAFVNINNRIYMVRNIVDSTFRPIAVIVMELNVENIFGSLESIWGYYESDVFIDGLSMFHVYEKDPCTELIKERFMKTPEYFNGPEGSYVYKRMETGRHKIAYAITLDKTAITDETVMVKYLLLLLTVFMAPLIIIVFAFFHQSVNKPIRELRRSYKEIEKENYGYHIEVFAQHEEFADLDEAFNSMSDKLKYQFEKIYLEELALRDANIMALQSQINPHFLNNTLEIINWEARMVENYKVSTMIEALSTMLEATMNRKSEQMIPLSEEMSYADAYLYIISQRFGEKLEVHKQIDEQYLRVLVPRLIIQPILENAIEHGMNFRKQGKLWISVYGQEDKLIIEVVNNGKLSEQDRIKIEELLSDDDTKETHSLSLGIRNVNKRLKIIYGPECGLTIKSNKENHTISTIIVKMNNKEEQ